MRRINHCTFLLFCCEVIIESASCHLDIGNSKLVGLIDCGNSRFSVWMLNDLDRKASFVCFCVENEEPLRSVESGMREEHYTNVDS